MQLSWSKAAMRDHELLTERWRRVKAASYTVFKVEVVLFFNLGGK